RVCSVTCRPPPRHSLFPYTTLFRSFQLEIELADTAVEMLGLDDRGVADQVEYGLGNGHAVARDPGAGWVRRTRASLRDDAWGRRAGHGGPGSTSAAERAMVDRRG